MCFHVAFLWCHLGERRQYSATIHAHALFPLASLPTLYNELRLGASNFLYVLHKDWHITTRPNPHTCRRSILVECCHGLYRLNLRRMNHSCLIHALPTLRHVSCTTSPMSSNENPLTNHQSTYMHHTSLPLAIKIGSWHTSLQLDICHRYRNPTTLCTWTWQPSTRSSISKTLNIIPNPKPSTWKWHVLHQKN